MSVRLTAFQLLRVYVSCKEGGWSREGRKEEDKGSELAIPCRQHLPSGASAARSDEDVYREVRDRS